ncbi:hypothetical protein BDQ12DRAFT_711544 [Crucibulum laeve]|uniref:Uncharacterized protein n=1 Tax=Crucibulum laeve TaxID=68775 RepID=A0A5C3M6V1_9AGAR|nr:hypothetical protein BDQ12DRAFT_711544 [Crucibulum laeve]
MLFTFLSFLALSAAAAGASATPTRTVALSSSHTLDLNPPADVVQQHLHLRVPVMPQVDHRDLTNAERIRAGLPLRKPARRRTVQGAHASASASPRPSSYAQSTVAVAAEPSATADVLTAKSKFRLTTRSTRGYLQMIDAETDAPIGFVHNNFNAYGEYGAMAGSDDRLVVSLNLDEATWIASSIMTVNGPDTNYPLLGAITGSSSTSMDLAAGSYNYAHVGGTQSIARNSAPSDGGNSFSAATGISETIESAIWTVDTSMGILTAHWTNSDLSKPTVYIGRAQESLILTGDTSAFENAFGPTQWITLVFLPM